MLELKNPAILPKAPIDRTTMMTYTANSKDLQASARALFAAVKNGVKIEVNQRYAMKDAVQAHRDLEARKTTGSTIFEV